MTVGEAVFVRVVVMLPVAVLLVVWVPAADCDAVTVTVLEPEVVFVSLFVGVCDPVLVPDVVIESVAAWLPVVLGDRVVVADCELV